MARDTFSSNRKTYLRYNKLHCSLWLCWERTNVCEINGKEFLTLVHTGFRAQGKEGIVNFEELCW